MGKITRENQENKTYSRSKGVVKINITVRTDVNSEVMDCIDILKDIIVEMENDLKIINKK
jgi:hypothetical protein